MTETTEIPSSNLDALTARIHGAVLRPDANGYDDERTGFQQLAPHRPAVIVGAADADDIAAAVEFAVAHRVPVAVQSSGHGLATGLAGGVLISTRRMNQVRVEPDRRTAWVPAGASWQQVIEAADPHGLAPLSGSSPGVGAVSYTLGGGLGLLARKYGFAADHVRRIELVTAAGELLMVDERTDSELFWGLRGGGGNFGIVAGMEIELLPITTIFGGGLYFDVARQPDVLERWRQWTKDQPAEMTSALAMLVFPDMDVVPAELRGRHVVQLQVSYCGSTADGEALVEPLRALGPIRDTLHELPYTESATAFDEPDRPHAYRSQNRLLADLDPQALATLPAKAAPTASAMCVVQLRQLGGALANEPEVPNAVGHRNAGYALTILSPIDEGTEKNGRGKTGTEQAVQTLHGELLAPFAEQSIGRLLNFSYGPLDGSELREAVDENDFGRLVALKARLDPQGVIRANHPIPGTAG